LNKIYVEEREVTPSKIVCVGRNYIEHIKELGNEVPDEIVIFIKPNSSISNKLVSFHSEQLHYEGELSFLFEGGRFSSVGFGLDLTKRKLQANLKEKRLPWERAKAFNGSAIFSKFVSISDSNAFLSLSLKINEITIQSTDINHMIHKPDEILTEILTFMTLEDGDIVMTGTPGGVGVVNSSDVFVGHVYENGKPIVSATWIAE